MSYAECSVSYETDDSRNDIDEGDYNQSLWCYLPDAVLLQVFSHLDHQELLTAGLVCKSWNNISYDDWLWRDLFHKDFKIDPTIYSCKCFNVIVKKREFFVILLSLACKPKTWLSEYKRLCYHIPIAQTETLTEHQHQVLHVSFAHNGKLFATCSKDGYILVN